LLGTAETIGPATELFAPLPGKNRLYRRREAALQPGAPVEFPSVIARPGRMEQGPAARPAVGTPPNLAALTDALLLLRFSPAAVLATAQGDIVYISGRTGKYLEPATGKANLNLFAMARDGLAGILPEAFARAVRSQTVVELKALKLGSNGGTKIVDVTVQPLAEPAALRGMVLVVFTDIATLPPAGKPLGKAQRARGHAERASALEQELQHSREELHSTHEEMQTSQEELKSTNEELQSTNEELQSSNEELTTSKEEMQSMNEELQTVNHELTAKVDEFSRVSDDMKNLLNSTDIATLFLDGEHKVRRFTTQAADIIKLIPGDVGRPITDLVTTLDYPALTADVGEVLRTLIFHECKVPAGPGQWFRVRIMPYRTQDNRIDGVAITFTDISASKALETTLREALAVLQSRFTKQTTELDEVKTLDAVLKKAQAVLEQRFTAQTTELLQSRADLVTEKRRKGK
jgi:two-component system CheB/CheR fusion protein